MTEERSRSSGSLGYSMVDPFILALGLAKSGELPEKTKEVLAREAERFLRGGGSISSLLEWASLGEDTRNALVEAGDKIRSEQAYLIARASQGPMQAAQVLATVDDGATLEAMVVRAMVDRVAEAS